MYIDKDTKIINLRFGGGREYIKGVILNDDTIIQNMQCDLRATKPTEKDLQSFEDKNKNTFKQMELKELHITDTTNTFLFKQCKTL